MLPRSGYLFVVNKEIEKSPACRRYATTRHKIERNILILFYKQARPTACLNEKSALSKILLIHSNHL